MLCAALAMSKLPAQEKGEINTKEWLTQIMEQKMKGIVGTASTKVRIYLLFSIVLFFQHVALFPLSHVFLEGQEESDRSKAQGR